MLALTTTNLHHARVDFNGQNIENNFFKCCHNLILFVMSFSWLSCVLIDFHLVYILKCLHIEIVMSIVINIL